MIGAICGDILGSTYEYGIEGEKVYLIHQDDHFTDDTVLTFATAKWVMEYINVPLGKGEHKYLLAKNFFEYTEKYDDKAYGLSYVDWIWKYEDTGKSPKPNNSCGNGVAMRVSPIAYACNTVQEVEYFAKLQSEVTHFNSEAIRGACAIASATKMALDGCSKTEIKDYISNKYFYDLSRTLEEVTVVGDDFHAICQITVPQALIAFLEGDDFRDTMLKAINIGGDCDTVASMSGAIAYAYYKEIPQDLLNHCLDCLDNEMRELYFKFEKEYIQPSFR